MTEFGEVTEDSGAVGSGTADSGVRRNDSATACRSLVSSRRQSRLGRTPMDPGHDDGVHRVIKAAAAALRRFPRTPQLLVPAAIAVPLVLVQISYPLTSGVARDQVTVAVVLLLTGTAMVHAAATRGTRYAAGFLVIASGLGLASEILGTATGFPFGTYEYADGRLGPAVVGVPLVVALAWTGGLYPMWVVAGLLSRRMRGRIVLTAVGALGWDLFLDPQMVADGQWRWSVTDAGLPGIAHIPLTNYVGWFSVALVMAMLLTILDRLTPAHHMSSSDRADSEQPATVSDPPRMGRPDADSAAQFTAAAVPIAVFLWTWLGSALAHAVFLDLPYSAGYGGVSLAVLGVPLLALLIRAARGTRRDTFRPSRGNLNRWPGTM